MARYGNIPSGSGSTNPSASICDTAGRFMQVEIQNPSGVDVYVSEDRTRLDATAAGTNLPLVGLLFPAAAPPQVYSQTLNRFKGKLYARSQAPGAQLEVITSDLC